MSAGKLLVDLHMVLMRFVPFVAFLAATFFSDSEARADDSISFSRSVRPLLASRCFPCHGPDAESRQADLRLDMRDHAVASNAIVPGKPDESELVRRILSADPDERMPPASSKQSLTDDERHLLFRWIAEGARYDEHWAFVPPQRPSVPTPDNLVAALPKHERDAISAWPRHPIDHFVLQRMLPAGLRPAPEADRYELIRRVSLDLIGLPPTPQEADAFVADADPQAYEKLVERLLQSKHYGERWGRLWLDLARYSDTNGYEKDRPRSIWPYRDWVIRALNDDMPFDRFTIEQLAGDMLPEGSDSQRVATGFHRNTMLNEEGGIDPLEYRFYAMADRVATTGIVWLGMTTGCAQCHTHKYDPLTHTDYYRLMALLNNADEPDLRVRDPEIARQRAEIERRILELEAKLPEAFPPDDGDGAPEERRQRNLAGKFEAWLTAARDVAVDWQIVRPARMTTNLPRLEILPDGSIFSSGDVTKRDVFTITLPLESFSAPITALRIEALPDERLPDGGPGRAYYEGRKGDFFLSEVTPSLGERTLRFASGSTSYGKISIGSGQATAENVFDGDGSTGWSTAGREGQESRLVLIFAEPLPPGGELTLELLFERHFVASLGRFRFSLTTATKTPRAGEHPADVEALLARDPATLNLDELARLKREFLAATPELAEARKAVDQLRASLPAYPTTLVFEERPADNPRPTHRHHRGEYLSPREAVAPALPELFRRPGGPDPTDRLQFARWLVSEDNPLVARVTVNRAWRAFFGEGLVRSHDDFGTQSEPPTHPELLDWLSREFIERGWSVKSLHRAIVTSATYRQSAIITAESLERDPENRLLARGPRFRLDAEMVRDSLLSASGLLNATQYGPSVYPPQPASVTAIAYGETRWNPSTGPDRYRRSVYTFSKRTAPFAAYTVFDGPTGETCLARRERSNTPLQALTLLNDEMYIEFAAAAVEHQRAEFTGEHSREEFAAALFRRFLTRPPSASEHAALLDFQHAQKRRLDSGELDPAKIGRRENADADTAAWIMTARALMNLDETITKP